MDGEPVLPEPTDGGVFPGLQSDDRRRWLQDTGLAGLGWATGGWIAWGAPGAAGAAAPAETRPAGQHARVLRYAFPTTETGFDPAQISDLYSRTITAHVFEALYQYDHLARPAQLRPCLAEGLPEVSEDFTRWTVRMKPGVFFQDDPAFGGQPREVTAQDWVFTFRRVFDPALKSPGQPSLEEMGILGLKELREAALKGQPFDYDSPLPGMQVLDRYTLQFRLREPRPRFLYTLAAPDVLGVMAHEVVQRYGDKIMEHPVGTGPFRLASWRRSSRIVLERNPTYREVRYDARPAADDAEGQALLARLKGRRLPMLDRVEVSIIEEAQPRWLSFLAGEQDLLQIVPPEFIAQAIPEGQLAPNLARRGIRAARVPAADVSYQIFNWEHPLVGGNAPEKVALRRAMALGYDIEREIRLIRHGQAIPAQGMTVPGTFGHDPAFRTDAARYDLARARALLDLYGWQDRDGDGWRETPDGQPLVLEMLSQSDQTTRAMDELLKKSLNALGLKLTLKIGQWSENLKAARAGRFMMWRVGSSSSTPDGQGSLERVYSGSIGKGNLARFRLPALDTLYQRMQGLPDGPQRQALFREANRLAVAYMPYRMTVHRILCDLTQPGVVGYRRPVCWLDWWSFVDVNAADPAGA
ncbi:MAG: bicyclomycin resistance protein [Burkholderiales bacterium]|jgi:ABC-type transport system substrate-binding protein|nr:bicyclomycin resistance protein [Burkholderiales bacterium]MBP6250540.1 bicyclomycin resistance protein [Leptothrix sp. (in: b-proteobacteria)]MBP7522171.1 bicyclomycin resistance protein [Leptothrix sp. (in: b-proteobacteria)]